MKLCKIIELLECNLFNLFFNVSFNEPEEKIEFPLLMHEINVLTIELLGLFFLVFLLN